MNKQALRVHVAGSTCTSWSRMGTKRGWAATSALAFAVWAFETLAQRPDALLRECTQDFDVSMLESIFGEHYTLASYVFSPIDLGYPASRPRRYTLLLLRRRLEPTVGFNDEGFGGMFFRHCVTTGHIFWRAPKEPVNKHLSDMAVQKRHLPPTQTDGEPWLPRDVLPEGLHVRLLAYEKACRKARCPLKFIVNLCQNQSFMKGRSEFVPTLLTHTSALWSMRVGRLLFFPTDHLGVQGVPIYAHGRDCSMRFGVEMMALAGRLTDKQIMAVAGNGMNMVAVGVALMFLLCTSNANGVVACMPVVRQPCADHEQEQDP